jgi:hypothetical protein
MSKSGNSMPAIPVPIVKALRNNDDRQKYAPLVGEHNDEFFK